MNGLGPLPIPNGSSLGALLGSDSLYSSPQTGNLNGRPVTREPETGGCCLWECLQAIFCFTEEEGVQPKKNCTNEQPLEPSKKEEPKELPPIAEETEGEDAEVEMSERKTSSEGGKGESILVN